MLSVSPPVGDVHHNVVHWESAATCPVFRESPAPKRCEPWCAPDGGRYDREVATWSFATTNTQDGSWFPSTRGWCSSLRL